jgi:outer membrane lipoprotein-sorting protein
LNPHESFENTSIINWVINGIGMIRYYLKTQSGRNRPYYCVLGIALSLCFCTGWADTWDGIRAAADQIESISAEFVQEKQLPILARPLVSRGVLYFRKPASLRWEYRQPVRNILLMHKGSVQRYRDTGQGLQAETGAGLQAMQFVMAEIANWFKGRFDNSRMFTARLETRRQIVLVPKEAAFEKVIQKIELRLADRPGVIESVTIYESRDSFTRLTFENTRLNADIPDALFRSAG